MTIEKAIEILNVERLPYNETEADKFCEAYNMAIEALKEKQVAIEKYGEVNGPAYIQGIHDGANCEKSRILEKIKEEIKALKIPVDENCATNKTVDKVIAIIERYMNVKEQ